MSTGRIELQLTSPSWGTGGDAVAMAEVVSVPGMGTRSPGIKLALGINNAPHEISLVPGDYLVRVFMPNGDVQAERVRVDDGAKEQVIFELKRSPHEWLAAAKCFGVVQTLPKIEDARSLEVALPKIKHSRSLEVALPKIKHPRSHGSTILKDKESLVDINGFAKRVIITDLHRNALAVEQISRGHALTNDIKAWRWITNVDKDRPWPESTLSPTDLTKWWIGNAEPISNPMKIIEADEFNAKLVPIGPPLSILRSDRRRSFVEVHDPTGNAFYLVYPECWVSTTKSKVGMTVASSVLMTVVLDTVMNDTDDLHSPPARWRCTTEIDDVEAMSLLGFLHSGQSDAGQMMLARACDWLFNKTLNPVAAAAGAYMLLSHSEEANTSLSTDWRSWVHNLYKLFPMLPDGAIAMARLALAYGEKDRTENIDVEKLRSYTLEAIRRGLPYLSYGIRILGEVLQALQGDDEANGRSGSEVEATRLALSLVRQLGRITVPGEYFTVLKLGDLNT